MKRGPHCCWSWTLVPAMVMWSEEENRAIRPSSRPPMAWRRPSRSRPGQGRWEFLDSGGAAGGCRAGPSGAGMGLEADAGTGARTGQA